MNPARFAKLRAVVQYVKTHPVTVVGAIAIPVIEWAMHWLNGRHACGHGASIAAWSILVDVWGVVKCRTRTAGQVAGDIIDAANKCPDKQERPPNVTVGPFPTAPEPPARDCSKDVTCYEGKVYQPAPRDDYEPLKVPTGGSGAQEQTHPPLVLKFDPWGYWFIDALPENIDPPKKHPIRAKKKHKRK